MLRDYLHRRFPEESLHNRLWILEASSGFKGLISPEQQREILGQLRSAQLDDGGWSLAGLGNFRRVDGSAQTKDSDGYATGLALHALILAGEPAHRPEVAKGIGWLRSHQRADGSWPGISVNKERDPSTFTGKLMIDAATAFAARALVEANPK
jgi:squalene-hopene/tetraprenyl-beta-curcumene cyclase